MVNEFVPPAFIPRQEIREASSVALKAEPRTVTEREDIFDVEAVGFLWTIAGKVYVPDDDHATDPSGRRIAVFMLHGGGGDHLHMEPVARYLAARRGYSVVSMTFPGNLYLWDESRLWPGETVTADGVARTPAWHWDVKTEPDEYAIETYNSDPKLRAKYGTQIFARAIEGSHFYHRMAGWPAAFEAGMLEICRRNVPAATHSVYVTAHSTGGPFAHALSQRLENAVGIIGAETSPFGQYYGRMLDINWPYSFDHLALRTWRDIARYVGKEVPLEAVRQLPSLMESVHEQWEHRKVRPSIKAQYMVHFGATQHLNDAATVTAARLEYSPSETAALIRQYESLPSPLEKPIPPILYCIGNNSADHTLDKYTDVLLPEYARLKFPPKVNISVLDGGMHYYWKRDDGLPLGVLPAMSALWDRAIQAGYFIVQE